MARKKMSKDAKASEVFEIPETHRPFLEIDPGDNSYVFIKMRVLRFPEVPLRKGAESPQIDVAQFAGSMATQKLWDYGLGRFCRDGAKAQEITKDSDGEKITRDLTLEERIADAEANAHKKIQALYGNRPLSTRGSGVSVLVRETRVAFVGYCIAKVRDAEGKAYKRNTVPSSIAAGNTADAILAAAIELGVPKAACEKLCKRACDIAALREDTTDLDIEID